MGAHQHARLHEGNQTTGGDAMTKRTMKMFATAAMLVALTTSVAVMPARAGDVEDAVKVTMMMVTVTCLTKQNDHPPTNDQLRYFGDSMFAVSMAQGGLNKELMDRAQKYVTDYYKKIGEAEFCQQNLPQLDRVVQSVRTEFPRELEAFRRDFGKK
jgi:hypothetical protein